MAGVGIKVIHHPNCQEYRWHDPLGFHQYWSHTATPTLPETIHDFQCDNLENGCVYSWYDNLGFHQQFYHDYD